MDSGQRATTLGAMMQAILAKLCSGRWILTVACAWAFVHAAITGTISSEGITAIIVSVFKDYFNRDDRRGDNGTGAQTKAEQ